MKRRIAVLDSETDPFLKGRIPAPFAWGHYDGQVYSEFISTDAVIAFLREQRTICYAHNGGKFDFHFLLDALEPYDDIAIINGRIARMYIGKCELRDSMLIIPQGLGKYKKDEIDYAMFEPGERDKPANRRAISAYLKNDCLYLHEMVSAFIDRFGDCLTLAGAAMRFWKKMSTRENIEQCERTDAGFYDAIHPFYYGGRVECFESGIIETDFQVYDINSAYPFAMMQYHPYSASYVRVKGFVPKADFYRLLCVSAGAFPFRGEGGECERAYGLRFPHDDVLREYHVTGWEYHAALDTGALSRVTVLESLTFARHVTFAPYVAHWYSERKTAKAEGDALADLFAKLMLNSLYGKFAANPNEYQSYCVVPGEDGALLSREGSKWHFAGELKPGILLGARELREEEKRFYNVATGASITGYVRAMLWRALHGCVEPLYCDTDSIACRAPGRGMNVSDRLGDWKNEGSFDKAGIGGKKLYIFRGVPKADGTRDYKTASKGARLTHGELWRVAGGEVVEYQPDAPNFSVHKAPSFIDRTIRKTA